MTNPTSQDFRNALDDHMHNTCWSITHRDVLLFALSLAAKVIEPPSERMKSAGVKHALSSTISGEYVGRIM